MKRKVAQLVAPKTFEIIEEEIPRLGDGEMLLKVIACGLCHSDMPTYLGKTTFGTSKNGYECVVTDLKYPIRLGHEPIGRVVEVGKNVKKFKVGDVVTGGGDAGFSSYMIVKEDSLMTKVPEMNKEIKYCLGEPLACVTNIVRAADHKFGDYVAVIGCGMMGLMTIAGLKNSGAKELIAIDMVDSRLELAKKFGATKTVNPGKVNVEDAVYDLTNGHFCDVIVEITGSLRGLQTAALIAKIPHVFAPYSAERSVFTGRAKILMPSLYVKGEVLDPVVGYYLMFRSPMLLSTHPAFSMSLKDDTIRAVDGYADGRLPLDQLITHEFKLEDISKGFEMMEKAPLEYIKGVVVPD